MTGVFSFRFEADGERRTEIIDGINRTIGDRQYLIRLTDFYIIYFSSQADWQSFLDDMTNYAHSLAERLDFIISPMIPQGGIYNGLLTRNEWQEINNISNM